MPRQECAPAERPHDLRARSNVDHLRHAGHPQPWRIPRAADVVHPRFDVALSSPNLIKYAAEAINLMGQQSQTAAATRASAPFDEAIASQSPLAASSPTMARLGRRRSPAPLAARRRYLAHCQRAARRPPSTSMVHSAPSRRSRPSDRAVLAISGRGDWGARRQDLRLRLAAGEPLEFPVWRRARHRCTEHHRQPHHPRGRLDRSACQTPVPGGGGGPGRRSPFAVAGGRRGRA